MNKFILSIIILILSNSLVNAQRSGDCDATVNGYTTNDIHVAANLAGEGGKLCFPAGTYESLGLEVQNNSQTWELANKAIILRSINAINNEPSISVKADDWKLKGGVIDGNRYLNNQGIGIQSIGHSVDIFGTDIVGTKSYGIQILDASLKMDQFSIRKTGGAAILWRITSSGVQRPGPILSNGKISRSIPSDWISSGGILIQSQVSTKLVIAPRLDNIAITLPQGNNLNAVGMECLYCVRGVFTRNEINGGLIGLSFGHSNNNLISSNTTTLSWEYPIELAQNSTYNLVIGNNISCYPTNFGGSPPLPYGIENSLASNYNAISSNKIANCPTKIRISSDSVGVISTPNW